MGPVNGAVKAARLRPRLHSAAPLAGLRINPLHSEGTNPLYDPCAPGSRLGIPITEGEAAAINTGVLVGTVLDLTYNALDLAILDTSATCHMPIAIGGEHSVTYGVIRGLLAAGVSDIGVVQIDTHADLRDAYEDNPLSHASVMRRIVDLDIPLYQLDVRAYCEE